MGEQRFEGSPAGDRYPSLVEPQTAIKRFLAETTNNPKPFVCRRASFLGPLWAACLWAVKARSSVPELALEMLFPANPATTAIVTAMVDEEAAQAIESGLPKAS